MSQRLTESMRETIVRAVVADLPQVDYLGQEVKIRQGAVYRQMPAAVKAIYDDKSLRDYLTVSDSIGSVVRPGGRYSYWRYIGLLDKTKIKLTAAEETKIQKLAEMQKEQDDRVVKARKELCSALAAFNTVKQAREAMPELAKYLPDDEKKTANLPATSKGQLLAALKDAGLKLKAK